MFRCEFCQQLQGAGIPSVLVAVQTRAVTYPRREKIHPPLPGKGQGERRRDDPGGVGFETVREQRCCPACACALA